MLWPLLDWVNCVITDRSMTWLPPTPVLVRVIQLVGSLYVR
jgi:hypothetical protein